MPLISNCSMMPAWHQLVSMSGHVEESETARKLQLYATSIYQVHSFVCQLDYETYAPPTTRTRLVKTRMPYYNDSIHDARRERRRAERKWRKTRSELDRELYLIERRNVNDLTMSAELQACCQYNLCW